MLRALVHRLRRFLQRRRPSEATPKTAWHWDPSLQLWYHIPSGRHWDSLRSLWYDPHTHTWQLPAAVEPDQEEADEARRWHHVRHPALFWWLADRDNP